jgi:Bacterial Ig domain/Glucodextranase, domain B
VREANSVGRVLILLMTIGATFGAWADAQTNANGNAKIGWSSAGAFTMYGAGDSSGPGPMSGADAAERKPAEGGRSNAGALPHKDETSVPSIAFVAPGTDATYVVPAAPVLYVVAYADDTAPATGIDHVDFLDGDILIGTVSTPNSDPVGHGYALVWTNPALGTHLIYARATDTRGNSSVPIDAMTGLPGSIMVSVIEARASPRVSLTAPSTGQTYAPSSTVPLSAIASSVSGTIRRVEFAVADTIVGTATSPPFAVPWNNPPPGDFAVVARAYDDFGTAATSAAAYIKVLPSNRAPSVVVIAPSAGSSVPIGIPITLSADALAPDGTIANVEFYAGGQQIGTSSTRPYTTIWTAASTGVVALTAKAIDRQAASATSAAVTINVINGASPTVAVTSPVNGATFTAPATIDLSAMASEIGGAIGHVDFIADGNVINTTNTIPFAFSWAPIPVGTYTLTAKATDLHGATATAPSITVTVSPSVPANHPPVVSLEAPSSGQTFNAGQGVVLGATATDSDGSVARVEFLVDGEVFGTSTSIPYSVTWTTSVAGSHAISARAIDNQNAAVTTPPITVAIVASSPATVALTAPDDGQSFVVGTPIDLLATVNAIGTLIDHVVFYGDGIQIGLSMSAPYRAVWSGATVGTHALSVRAISRDGVTSTSVDVSVRISPLELAITVPATDASVNAEFTLVTGTYQGPPNSGITVNGIVARNDGKGRYFVNNLALAADSNLLEVVLTTQDGHTATQTRTISSASTMPIQVYADSDADFAPHVFTIHVKNRTGNAVVHVSYSDLEGGQLDTSTTDQSTLGSITYEEPGVHTPSFVITDSLGNTYTQTVALVAQDRSHVDQVLKAVWNGFGGALAIGDIQGAMAALSSNARVRYGPILSRIAPSLGMAVASWEAPQTGALDSDVAEYTVLRTVDGIKHLYFIYLLLDTNGIWQLDSM